MAYPRFESAKIITLSTAHLHPETREYIESVGGNIPNGPSIAAREFGFFLNSGFNSGIPVSDFFEATGNIPAMIDRFPDIVLLQSVACAQNATWICIDSDGEVHDRFLPVYEDDGKILAPAHPDWQDGLSTLAFSAADGASRVRPSLEVLKAIEEGVAPADAVRGVVTGNTILEDSGMVTIAREGAGIRIISRLHGGLHPDMTGDVRALVEGAEADAFVASLEDMRKAHATPGNIWFEADWDNALAHLCDDHLAAQNPGFAAWREAAQALGWKFVERDPNMSYESKGPELHNADVDRVMPLGAWQLCVVDLGYRSPEEVMAEKRAAPVEEVADEPETP